MTSNQSSFGYEILDAIRHMLDDPSHKQYFVERLSVLKQRILAPEHAFDVESLVYGGILSEALDSDTLMDSNILQILKNQLEGQQPYWVSYLLKYDFQTILKDESVEAYQLLCSLAKNYVLCSNQVIPDESTAEELEQSLEKLQFVSCRMPSPRTLGELVVAQACHILLTLPYPPVPTFDIQDNSTSFSVIYPPVGTENVSIHLDYLHGLIRKMQGRETLYVDVQFMTGGYSINIR